MYYTLTGIKLLYINLSNTGGIFAGPKLPPLRLSHVWQVGRRSPTDDRGHVRDNHAMHRVRSVTKTDGAIIETDGFD